MTNSAKWQCPVITQAYTSIPGTHFVLKSGGGDEAQQQCLIHGMVHFKRGHKYVMHSSRSTIAGFTVAVVKQFAPLRDASGRPTFSGSSDTCLPALTDFMLRSSFFQCGTFTFKQIQGASALAPVLCTLVASTTEFLWLHNFRNVLLNIGLLLYGMRTIVPFFFIQAFDATRGPDCCFIWSSTVPPFCLGTTCSVTQGTITTLQPVDATLLRTLKAVGDREHVLSSFSARTRTIIRLTRPMRLIRPQVEDLIEIYQARGFSRRCLVQIAHRLLKSVGIQLLE